MRKVSKKRAREAPLMRKWHDEVFKRDGYKCVKCGGGVGLQAHHIKNRDYTKLRTDIKNGLCVCFMCHVPFFHSEPKRAKEWLEEHRPEQYKYLYEVNDGKSHTNNSRSPIS